MLRISVMFLLRASFKDHLFGPGFQSDVYRTHPHQWTVSLIFTLFLLFLGVRFTGDTGTRP